ncbi:MAG TPA: TadE/TadG family type IV pilus assembly protein [Xanthobacteraceae bacterium]|jgi:Flp pilus assembly protein TadG|nr:TadE/TadG family type IV pilus assembly protein [Xanthobacteraceae bacterium]
MRAIRQRLIRRTLRRFVRQRDGAAAVEFAFVAGPFLLLLVMIMETAMVFFADEALETAAADAARLVLTGQAQSLNQSDFKATACAHISAFTIIDCNKVFVDIQPSSTGTFGGITSSSTSSGLPASSKVDPVTGKTIFLDADGNEITPAYQVGSAGTIMVVRLAYQMPIPIPFVSRYLTDSPASDLRLLVATAAFRNEPFN